MTVPKKIESHDFTFIDLFAGIGGFHIAMHHLGGKCVFASEMDTHARKTYEHNFKKISPELFNDDLFNNDIRNIMPEEIPDFDVLCAGFPCQPFSQAGFKRGFDDNHKSERGNLFFNIAEIIEAKRPKAFFLENVRGIVKHDNGNTFKIIRKILEEELGYSFYFKVVKASDYGLPQLRPRAFMIGFRDESFMRNFSFPPPTQKLKFTMSDVWGGECSREVGFTIRVGGRGSNINDRRNWDSYLVDGEVKKLSYVEGKKMQGFPSHYEFPVSATQAIKQLGNSVAIDAIQAVGKNLIQYMNSLHPENNFMKKTKNKGEWTELLVFIKLLAEQKIYLSDVEQKPTTQFFNIHKVTTQNLDLDFFIIDNSTIKVCDKEGETIQEINISKIINSSILESLTHKIKETKGRSFEIPSFDVIQNELGFSVVKGGDSYQKADISLDISNDLLEKENEGFGIKSYLGSKPTLLNSSGNTNFVFRVDGLDKSKMDEINAISTRTKLKDRIKSIQSNGGKLVFIKPEKDAMKYNLKMVDSFMPKIIGQVLLTFFENRIAAISKNIDFIDKQGALKKEIDYEDKPALENKIKKLLVDALLGFFPGKKWDGGYGANGTIVMKKTGDFVAFHIIDLEVLKSYLYHNIKLDTPSASKHRYGKLYLEKDGKLYFKLNLQLRF